MSRVYFPGCKVKARYPQASAALAKIIEERGYADETAGCCRVDHQKLKAEDTALCLCVNCMAMIDEDAKSETLEHVYVLMANDPDLKLPSYPGKTVTVQDCGRSYDRRDVQDAVRTLLRRMEIEVVEAPDAFDKTTYCGAAFLGAAPEQDAGFAPRRYVEDAAKRGIFVPHSAEEIEVALKKHVEELPTKDVVCYCTACDAGLVAGGAHPVNIIELITGEFIDR